MMVDKWLAGIEKELFIKKNEACDTGCKDGADKNKQKEVNDGKCPDL